MNSLSVLLVIIFLINTSSCSDCEFKFYGNSSEVQDSPWLVKLFNKEEEPSRYFCGALLISKRHLLTGEQNYTFAYKFEYFFNFSR